MKVKGIRNCTVALLLGMCAPLLIWAGAGSALYAGFISQRRTGRVYRALKELTCAMDSDCPPGHVCIDGQCIPAE